ncbi:MAG: reductive dehalogenase [Bacillota bacterium]
MPRWKLKEHKPYGGVIGVKTAAQQTAAEIYKVRDDYRRFNQKFNMIWQPNWKEEHKNHGDLQRLTSGIKRVQEQRPGFSTLDWAFLSGAEANFQGSGFPINLANQRGNSWSPVGLGLPDGLARWEPEEAEAARLIKKMALYFGADLTGICKLDRRWVYSHYFNPRTNEGYPIYFSDEAPGYESVTKPGFMEDGTAVIPGSMKYAIVFLHEMDYDGMRTAPTMTQMATTHFMYSKIAFTAVSVAEFIRGLGYNAIPSANCTALNVPLAIDAGLGQLGRHAKLISPVFGPRCRISKVITDLPLAVDRPIDFGVAAFCESCKLCAESCPVQAIPYDGPDYEPTGDFSHSKVCQWQVKHDRCRIYWAKKGTNCGLCINRCPYNRVMGFRHRALTSLAALLPVLNKWQLRLAQPGYLEPAEFWRKLIK